MESLIGARSACTQLTNALPRGLDGTAGELWIDGGRILEGMLAKDVPSTKEGGDTEDGVNPQPDDGQGGTGGSGAFGGTIRTSDGAGTAALDSSAGGTDAANTRPDDIFTIHSQELTEKSLVPP